MDERIIAQSSCPYCGAQIELLVDWSAGKQAYVEDCEICCRPMNLKIAIEHWGPMSTLKWQPRFDSLRSDPRYTDLMMEMGLIE